MSENKLNQHPLKFSAVSVGVFWLLLHAFEFLSHVAMIIHGWEFLERNFSFLARVPPVAWDVAGGILAFAFTMAIAKFFLSKRLRDIEIGNESESPLRAFNSDKYLVFRHIQDEHEIELLEKTENYGARGKTNIPQATDWWRTYSRGNVIAIYKGEIVGGTDIWPIKEQFYLDVISGKKGEDQLLSDELAVQPRNRKRSYWYVGSISLSMLLRRRRSRREILTRLIVETLKLWQVNKPVFPAHFVALAWTTQGINILDTCGFHCVGRAEHGDPVYQKTITNDEDINNLLASLNARLGMVVPKNAASSEKNAESQRCSASEGVAQDTARVA